MESPHRFLENVRIVLVDDHADFRLLAAWLLSRYGAQVFAAKNAFEGLRLVQEIHPDLVLSDILRKPFQSDQLLAVIDSVLSEKQH